MGRSASAVVSLERRLPPMPSIRDLLKLYNLRAQKQLSQNFLLDSNLTKKIVRCGGGVSECHVCEVGPGPGGITRALLDGGAKKVYVIEKDARFKPTLDVLSEYAPGRLEAHYGDALSFNMGRLFPEEERRAWAEAVPAVRIVGNLPFSVSTPLIVRWLKDISRRANAWTYGRTTLTLTFQEEVAERLVAEAAAQQRSRLSVMAQYLCHVYHKFSIPGSAFVPKPEVNVGVVKFVPRKEPLIKQPFHLVEKVVRQTFHGRQKFCFQGIKTLFPETMREELAECMVESAEVDRTTRPFQLTLDEFSRLCDAYSAICSKHPHVEDYNFRGHRADESWEASYGPRAREESLSEVDDALNAQSNSSNVIIFNS